MAVSALSVVRDLFFKNDWPAKNLVLAGVKQITLDDINVCTKEDLGTQFYIREAHIREKLTRAEASLPELAVLNPYVQVSLSEKSLASWKFPSSENVYGSLLKEVDCLVLTDCHLFTATLLNAFCRRHGIRFVYTNTIGVLGNIFCDFGQDFTVYDQLGLPLREFFISGITNEETPELTPKGKDHLFLSDGDAITFRDVSGMTELNGRTATVKVTPAATLQLDIDTRTFGQFSGIGVAVEHRMPASVSFEPIWKQIVCPDIVLFDESEPKLSTQAHYAFLSLMNFYAERGTLPAVWSESDADKVVKIAKSLQQADTEPDEGLIRAIAMTSSGQLAPLCSIFGGLAAQEALKAITHKFTPLKQWFYFIVDALLPNLRFSKGLHLQRSRYNPLAICVGEEAIQNILNASVFMVGCGAIGCEILKLLALMGFGTGPLSFAEMNDANLTAVKQVNNSSHGGSTNDWFFDGVSFPPRADTRDLTAIFEALSLRIIEHTRTPEIGASGHQPSRFGDTNPRVRPAGVLRLSSDDGTGRTGFSSPDGVFPLSPLVADVNAFGECAAAANESEAPTNSDLHGIRDVSVSETAVFETPRNIFYRPNLQSNASGYDADVESLALPTAAPQKPLPIFPASQDSLHSNNSHAVPSPVTPSAPVHLTSCHHCGSSLKTLPRLTITDMDFIEKSNLNRQFLFRPEHVGLSKSTVAAESTLKINPQVRIKALQSKLSPETERTIFTNDFLLESVGSYNCSSASCASAPHGIVIAALDNLSGRNYLDSRCVANALPLFESGTQGTLGHTQVILPHLTESYSEQRQSDAAETDESGSTDIPYCTLKSFPSQPSHCVEWAREKFFSQFTMKPRVIEKLLSAFDSSVFRIKDAVLCIRSLELQPFICGQYEIHPPAESSHTAYTSTQLEVIRKFDDPQANFLLSRPTSFAECVTLARIKFDKYFNHKARHLLERFPEHARADDGTAFWQLPRRRPTPLTFSSKDPLHVQFVWSFARLLAQQMGLQYPQADDRSAATIVEQYLSDFIPQPYEPSAKEIITDPTVRQKPATETVKLTLPTLLQRLNSIDSKYSQAKVPKLLCVPTLFEKDDEVLGHVDFVDAAANLRALMYGLPLTPRHEVKRIAGRIIPAIATTTAVVAGLVCVEILKFFALSVPLSSKSYDPSPTALMKAARNHFVNLALPSLLSIRPSPCQRQSLPNGATFSTWDRWTVALPHDATQFSLSELITTLKVRYGLNASLISQQSRVLYMNGFAAYNHNLSRPLLSLLRYTPEDSYVDLIVAYRSDKADVSCGVNAQDPDCTGEEDSDFPAPTLRILLPDASSSGTNS
ncbi:Ubiquitin-like modifier-activating enzyme 6 [Sparganum proliferum]